MPITADLKKKHLKSLSLALRHELEGYYEKGEWQAGDLERRLMSLGVRRERDALPLDEMAHLPEHDQKARKQIDEYIALRAAADMPRQEAVAEYVRETAYTWANRLLALRCMEARELIDEVILQKEVYGGRSLEHNRLLRAQPELSGQDDDGLFLVLDKAFARMAEHLPLLFDPHAPSIALRPSPAALKRCIALLSGKAPVRGQEYVDESVFKEPDALGWAYQFWNSEEKDRVFEAVRTKKAKIAGADIVPATQLYTEPYMVKFLVQNSLGATWLGMHPQSKLAERWEYFVRDADRAPIDNAGKKAVADLTFLDPACGSGHFLLEAFDLLFDMYQEEGQVTDEAAICKSILEKNLYGIDIDERAVQIAEAALWMKAKERAFDFTAARTNLIATNLRLPKDKNHLQAFLQKHPEDKPLEDALQTVFDGLKDADQLGTLLQVAEPVEKKLRAIKEDEDKKQLAYLGKPQRTFFDAAPKGAESSLKQFDIAPQSVLPVGVENWDVWRARTGERLRAHFAEEAEAADLRQQFFSAQASRGWRLFELLSRRYDVVAANPPYMGSKNMGPVLRKYVEQRYPTGKRDLYAAFILRCLELCVEGGRVAMVTQQSWMFLRSYAAMRADSSKQSSTGLLYTSTLDVLAHLGRYAFSEIGNAVVAPVLFVVQCRKPDVEHRLWACRLTAPRPSEQQAELLRSSIRSVEPTTVSKPKQSRFLAIPQSPLCYWLRERFFELLAGTTLGDVASVCQGLATANDARFVRFTWEAPSDEWAQEVRKRRWVPFEKGGGYGKWFGHHFWVVDWQEDGARVRQTPGPRVQNERQYFNRGWTYSYMARGSIGARTLAGDSITCDLSAGVFPQGSADHSAIGLCLNSRFSSYIVRSISAKVQLRESYVARIPIPSGISSIASTAEHLTALKKSLVSHVIIERNFTFSNKNEKSLTADFCSYLVNALIYEKLLLAIEALSEKKVLDYYAFSDEDTTAVVSETGTPAGWHPRVVGYAGLASWPEEILQSEELHSELLSTEVKEIPASELRLLKQRLLTLYESGPGGSLDEEEPDAASGDDEDEDESVAGARIPIPAETFLEELSQKLEIHPISVYWLLKEGIEKEGWRCIPEEQRFVSDRFTVTILRLLGHRWPRQVEAGEAVPEWADPDGIIPLTEGTHEATLYERIRARIAADFPGGDVASIEREFAEIMGKPLERWLETDFFKHHTQQFKKRPIAWQIQSGKYTTQKTRAKKPAFACLVYYHKLDGDTLPKLRSQYIGPLRARLETELRGIESLPKDSRSPRQQARQTELLDQISELREFEQRLEQVSARGFASPKLAELLRAEPLDAYCSIDGVRPPPADHAGLLRQEESYTPDLNDGVRVNIAPLQKAGLLAADVLASKDLDKAIADRAVWRGDERRWSREGKLPRPGYWREPEPAVEDVREAAQDAAV
ncbi:MAG: BREX-1 system adenine-specific DNA-methyltransferase PglX [Polyangia bacterium]